MNVHLNVQANVQAKRSGERSRGAEVGEQEFWRSWRSIIDSTGIKTHTLSRASSSFLFGGVLVGGIPACNTITEPSPCFIIYGILTTC